MELGAKPLEKFLTMFFQHKDSALFDIKRALEEGHFFIFAEKDRGPDPQDPPSCATGMIPLLFCFIVN